MKISLNWLMEFVDAPADPAELKAALTGAGLGIELFTPVGDDLIFEAEVTTNRPDCLSHLGVAREISALYRKPVKRSHFRLHEAGAAAESEVSVEISDPDLCRRYCARVIKGVQVRPSPAWLVRRLESVGVRAINNVADVTNYALMELGQPLHAFDLERLCDKKIVVRGARPGEHLRTLDGVDRALRADNLVIADGKRAVALAGVMGGEESEISAHTRSVLLESAWFEPISVRRTAKAHGMHTEASHHFERGADIQMAPFAAERAAALIAELAGGEVLKGTVDVYPRPYSAQELVLRSDQILRLLGTNFPTEEVERILRALGFEVQSKQECHWRVQPPSWRPDISREVDLIEEIARIHGYDRLPLRLRPAPPALELDTRRDKELAISGTLVSLGYREIISSSMVDPAENTAFTDRPAVRLLNPLSQDASAMRATSLPSMIRALRWNLDRGQSDLRLFEIGKTYSLKEDSPDERGILTLGLCGLRRRTSVHDSERPFDFFDLKGDVEGLLQVFDVRRLTFESADAPYLQAGIAGRYVTGDRTLASLGLLHHAIVRDYKLRQAPWLAEVDLDVLLDTPLRVPRFVPYSRFPAVERDLSLIVPEGVSYRELEEAVLGAARMTGQTQTNPPGRTIIQSVRPVDLFRGGQVPAGHYSLLLRITFHSLDHTLTSEEVEEAANRILGSLHGMGIHLRA